MSTPPEGEQPVRRSALVPTYIQQRRRTEALADLVREFREDQEAVGPDEGYESIRLSSALQGETEELPPVLVGENYAADGEAKPAAPPGRERWPGPGPGPGPGQGQGQRQGQGHATGLRPAAIVAAVAAAALIGFALATLLPGGDGDVGSQAAVIPSATAPSAQAPSDAAAADPDGAGTLREGDSGPDVTELQQRLLDIPDVYESGATSGTYDLTLTEAVARFQLWYGIRGDETGVYGNDTRAALESRT